MQKIFVKGYINRAFCSAMLGLIILIYFIFQLVSHGVWDGDANLYMPITGCIGVLLTSVLTEGEGIPDYLYIAPLSFDERIAIVKKQRLLQNIAFLVPVTVIGITPPFIYALITHIGSSALWSALVFIILTNSLIIKEYIPVIKRKETENVFKLIYIYSTIMFSFAFLMGLENFAFSSISEHIGEVVLAAIIFTYSLSGVIYCSVNYKNKLYDVYADYESFENTRDMLVNRKTGGTNN